MVHPVAQIIHDKGGATAMARALRVGVSTVRMWKSRKKLPRSAWPEINATYPDLTLKRLRDIEEQAKACEEDTQVGAAA